MVNMSKNLRYAISTFICIAISLLVYGTYIKPSQPKKHVALPWVSDLKTALANAAKSGKPIMVDFNAVWCGPCQEYKEHVFDTPAFGEMAAKFELVDLDVDGQKDVARAFGVDPIPDIWFLNSRGQPLMHVIGYDGDELVMDMQKALDAASQPAPAKPAVKEAAQTCD